MMTQTSLPEFPEVTAVYTAYYARLYRYILSMTHHAHEAEDLTQETFLRAYQGWDSLNDPRALTAWLYRIATHVCLDRLRQHKRHDSYECNEDTDEVEVADTYEPSLTQVVERQEMTMCVQTYLSRLSDSYRAVILLHDMHGLTAPEIAATLGVSLANIKIRLHRARERLKTCLQAACSFTHDEHGVLICEPKY